MGDKKLLFPSYSFSTITFVLQNKNFGLSSAPKAPILELS